MIHCKYVLIKMYVSDGEKGNKGKQVFVEQIRSHALH